ncbi:unnamed protein product [Schistosoma margrebowiei]|uniref:Uncharacterized protein n=1 Tax=Schistosoma margrebowiei TaxID=48269 RepID=A0A3P7ZAI4_9TREM|nr:unnamed protein product [Schistosoma margrebowiei]
MLLIVSDQRTGSILRRQLLIDTCIFWMMVVVVLQVFALYSRTVLISVLKILTLVLTDSCFEFHIFFNRRNAALALPILDFISASDPSCSSMMLPRYMKDSTSSKVSPSGVIGLPFSVLCLRTFVFPLCMLKPTDAETFALLSLFIRIFSCIFDRTARSSAYFDFRFLIFVITICLKPFHNTELV